MKKNKLAFSLVSSFIAAIAMSSCSQDVTSSKDSLVTFEGYNGEKISLVTNEMYEKYRKTSDGITKFYNAIMESIIRYEFKSGELAGKTDSTYSSIVKDAEKNVKGQKEQAKNNAKTNGTSYKKEWKSILESKGVETEKELLELFIYQLEKEEVEDWFYEENKESLKNEYIGVDNDGNKIESDVSSSLPYHIRHILVSISGGSTEFARSTISSSEAKKLATVAKELVEGKTTFGQIAFTRSDDEGSAVKFGDVGIMDLDTSFVNEFKLGIYAYDSKVHASLNKSNAAIESGLGLNGEYGESTTTVKDKIDSIGLTYVPHSAFEKIGEEAETEKDNDGNPVNDGDASYYPRNIYWNKYLNHHNPFVITNNELNAADINGNSNTVISVDDAVVGQPGFRYVEGVSKTLAQKVLTDEEGRVIIGVRSEHGIHLMVMQKSIYDFAKGGNTTALTSLSEYYTSLTPDDDGFPTYTVDGKSVNKMTYVNYLNTTDKSTIKERADEIKEKVKSFDATYDYRLYKELKENSKITFNTSNGINLEDQIDELIERTQENNRFNDAKTIEKSWRTYLELIDLQQANRTDKRLVSETCAINFKNAANNPEYQEGGRCYVKK